MRHALFLVCIRSPHLPVAVIIMAVIIMAVIIMAVMAITMPVIMAIIAATGITATIGAMA